MLLESWEDKLEKARTKLWWKQRRQPPPEPLAPPAPLYKPVHGDRGGEGFLARAKRGLPSLAASGLPPALRLPTQTYTAARQAGMTPLQSGQVVGRGFAGGMEIADRPLGFIPRIEYQAAYGEGPVKERIAKAWTPGTPTIGQGLTRGWQPTTRGAKVGKFATSLAADVALDPITYVGAWTLKGAKLAAIAAAEAAGRITVREGIERLGLRGLEALTEDMGAQVAREAAIKGRIPVELIERTARTMQEDQALRAAAHRGMVAFRGQPKVSINWGIGNRVIQLVSAQKLAKWAGGARTAAETKPLYRAARAIAEADYLSPVTLPAVERKMIAESVRLAAREQLRLRHDVARLAVKRWGDLGEDDLVGRLHAAEFMTAEGKAQAMSEIRAQVLKDVEKGVFTPEHGDDLLRGAENRLYEIFEDVLRDFEARGVPIAARIRAARVATGDIPEVMERAFMTEGETTLKEAYDNIWSIGRGLIDKEEALSLIARGGLSLDDAARHGLSRREARLLRQGGPLPIEELGGEATGLGLEENWIAGARQRLRFDEQWDRWAKRLGFDVEEQGTIRQPAGIYATWRPEDGAPMPSNGAEWLRFIGSKPLNEFRARYADAVNEGIQATPIAFIRRVDPLLAELVDNSQEASRATSSRYFGQMAAIDDIVNGRPMGDWMGNLFTPEQQAAMRGELLGSVGKKIGGKPVMGVVEPPAPAGAVKSSFEEMMAQLPVDFSKKEKLSLQALEQYKALGLKTPEIRAAEAKKVIPWQQFKRYPDELKEVMRQRLETAAGVDPTEFEAMRSLQELATTPRTAILKGLERPQVVGLARPGYAKGYWHGTPKATIGKAKGGRMGPVERDFLKSKVGEQPLVSDVKADIYEAGAQSFRERANLLREGGAEDAAMALEAKAANLQKMADRMRPALDALHMGYDRFVISVQAMARANWAKGFKQWGKPLKGNVMPTGWARINLPEFKGYVFPEEAVQAFENNLAPLLAMTQSAKDLGALRELWDSSTGLWKAAIVAGFTMPRWLLQAVVGNPTLAWYSGLRNPVRLFQAILADALGQSPEGLRGVLAEGLESTFRERMGAKANEALKGIVEQQVSTIEGPKSLAQVNNMIEEGLPWRMSETDFPMTEAMQKVPKFAKFDPFDRRFALYQAGFKAANWLDRIWQKAIVIDRLYKGDAPAQAFRHAEEFMFDYSNLSASEKWVRRYMVPFLTWTRKNTALQMKTLLRSPANISAPVKFAATLEQMAPEYDQRLKPTWVREQMGLRIPGVMPPQYLLPNLPLTDIARPTSARGMMRTIHPAMQILARKGFERDIYTGEPPTWGRLIGEAMPWSATPMRIMGAPTEEKRRERISGLLSPFRWTTLDLAKERKRVRRTETIRRRQEAKSRREGILNRWIGE